jgi:hypothetical protein
MFEARHLTRIAVALIILTYVVFGYHVVTYVSKMNAGKFQSSVMLANVIAVAR